MTVSRAQCRLLLNKRVVGLFPCFNMSTQQYVVKSTGVPSVGSEFTLTLAVEGKKKEQADENANDRDKNNQEKDPEADSSGEAVDAEFDEKFFALFKAVADEDLAVDAFELQSVIGKIFKRDFGMVKEFSIECCRSLIVMADADRSGKLDYGQFRKLFQWIMSTRTLYKSCESSQSWDMDSRDLKQLIRSQNYNIRQETIDLIAMKYRNRQLRIDFDDFLQICARLRTCHDSYESYQTVGDTFDDYLMHVIYT